ncbi:tRNA-splicing endonuclease subunit Sen54 isoform X2 [Anoplophora glabripennis]|uniref:tRNA-splicing endonuclease subunit Sen54 isoform X2 n=1 Tax=Anoplophora glabripennis TaxID=217634 RepID=UPI0008759A3C|nr:tRNA-splicing endonuclease subunit Sen54 isoform X2 [Anoplophora glabripennis]
MDSLAKKLINHHRNPIVKIDVSGSKLFLKSSTQEESEFIEKTQANLENILSYERADRRCARSLATWSSEDKLAKVTRTVKSLNNFGYQDKNGTYLYPEEALFLMETNRLEVTIDGVPLSVQEGYDLLLKHCECDAVKYRVYKKLALLGYRLLRYSELRRRLSKTTKKQDPITNNSTNSEIKSDERHRKRVLEAENEFNPKKIKINPETDQLKGQPGASNRNVTQSQYILNIFEKLRETAPREYDSVVTDDVAPQYCIFLPSNKSRCDYDFNLYICEDSILRSQHHNHATPSIYAICSEGNISFYRFSNTRLPIL